MGFPFVPALKLVANTSEKQSVASLMASSTTMNVNCGKKSVLLAL